MKYLEGDLGKQADRLMVDLLEANPQDTPYWIFEHDYWNEPREVCVVDEINFLENGNVEIICGINPKNERWIRRLASFYKFQVEKGEEQQDCLGKFVKFIVRK